MSSLRHDKRATVDRMRTAESEARDEGEPLCDLPLEREALGYVLLRPELLLGLELTDADFYSDSHARIWKELCWLGAEGLAIHTSSLRGRLLDIGKLQACGGDEYLLGLTDTIPHGDTAYFGRLRKLARLRRVRAASQRLTVACNQGDLDEATRAVASVSTAALEGAARNRPVDVEELCAGIEDDMARGPEPGQLFHPGYPIMREVLGLIPVQTSIGILADTSVGKSSVCLEVIARMAARNVVCGYVSVEDQVARVRARVAGMLSGVSSRAIIQHQLNERGREALEASRAERARLKRHLHFSILQGGTEVDVCAAMSELANRGVRVFVVDYLQKIRASRQRDSKAHEVAGIATAITSHAQKLNGVLFLVSQCTRDKQRMNECPSKHDMKESGDLENMLDFVIGLWREVEDDYVPVWARLVKTKDGGLGGSWGMERNRQTGRLEEIEGSHRTGVPDSGAWRHKQHNGRTR